MNRTLLKTKYGVTYENIKKVVLFDLILFLISIIGFIKEEVKIKYKIFSLIFAIITVLTVNGQNLKSGISLNYINDFDWNKPLADFLNTEKTFL